MKATKLNRKRLHFIIAAIIITSREDISWCSSSQEEEEKKKIKTITNPIQASFFIGKRTSKHALKHDLFHTPITELYTVLVILLKFAE